MKFGHYWPKDPASERIEHLRQYTPRFEMIYQTMPVLRFEPFSVGEKTPAPDPIPLFIRIRSLDGDKDAVC